MNEPRLVFAVALPLFLAGPRAALGQVEFVDVTAEVGLGAYTNPNDLSTSQHGGGVGILDYDGDGRPDLYLPRKTPPNVLLHNEGGWFTEVAGPHGAEGYGGSWVGVASDDVDGDGDADLLLSGPYGNRLVLNDGDGTFTELSATGIEYQDAFIRGDDGWAATIAAALADLDRDGRLDAYVANHARCMEPFQAEPPCFDEPECFSDECPATSTMCLGNSLFLQGDGLTFADKAAELGVDNDGCTLAVSISDMDGDGILDLYSGNDHGPQIEPDSAYFGNGIDGGDLLAYTPQPEDERLWMWNMGIAVGDYDADGDLDYYFANTQKNKLWQSLLPRFFVEAQDTAGVTGYEVQGAGTPKVSWGTSFEDFDLDGDLDLWVSNTNAFEFLFWNLGYDDVLQTAVFEQVLLEKDPAKAVQFGAAFADLDDDGDIDVLTGGMAREEGDFDEKAYFVWENQYIEQGGTNHFLKVSARATATHPSAVGARVRVRAGAIDQVQEVYGGGSFASALWRVRHFGLGEETVADVEVSWPSGLEETWTDLPADGPTLELVEGSTGSGDDDVTPGDDDVTPGDDDATGADDDGADDDTYRSYEVDVLRPEPPTCTTLGSPAGLRAGLAGLVVLTALRRRPRV